MEDFRSRRDRFRPRVLPPTVNPDLSTSAGELPEKWRQQFEKEIHSLSAPNLLKQQQPFLREDRFSVGNSEIHFCGVQHQPATLATFKSNLRSAVLEADLVILEGSPEIQLGKRSMTDALVEDYGVHLKTRSPMEIRSEFVSRIADGDFDQFYQCLTDMAAENGKTVALVDPGNLLGATLQEQSDSLTYWHYELPEKIEGGSKVTTGAGVILGAAAALTHKNPITSRRGLLRGAGYVGAAALPGVLGIASQKTSADLDRDPREGDAPINAMGSVRRIAEETAAYSQVDLRNIIVAEKLEALSKVMPKGTKITVVYGDGHRKALQDYVSHPDLRAAKKRLYEVTGAIDPRAAIGAWSFDHIRGQWMNDTKETELLTRFLTTA